MTAPTQIIKPPSEFIYMPIMYAWFAWKTGGTGARYSFELRNSLKKIRYRGELPHVDFIYGFDGLVHLIEDHHKGKFNVARIYGISNRNAMKGVIIREYRWNEEKKIDQLIVQNDPDFTSEKWATQKDKEIQRIYTGVRNAQKVTSPLLPQPLL